MRAWSHFLPRAARGPFFASLARSRAIAGQAIIAPVPERS